MTPHGLIHELSESGLLAPTDVKELVEDQSLAGRSVAEVAQELEARKKLTPYQASLVRQEKWKDLVLGEYLILDLIGTGGMGRVFRAVHRRMERVVAVKVLPQEATASPMLMLRFHQEIKAVSRLTHPNIVTAYDAGEHQGAHYLVMEHIEGTDLARRVRKHGPLPVAEAVDCIVQAARGLEHAHEKGVIHRDVKPANLLLSALGTVKVLDLGLASIRLSLGEPGGTAAGITQAGASLGTANYMAPEQSLDATTVDHRADIYSLGCTLYYLLTGKPIYSAANSMQRFLAHREGPIPSVRECRPEVTEALDSIFQRMVAKSPADRFASMSDTIQALSCCDVRQPSTPSATKAMGLDHGEVATEPLGESEAVTRSLPPPVATGPGAKRWWAVAGGIVILGLLGALLVVVLVKRRVQGGQQEITANAPGGGIGAPGSPMTIGPGGAAPQVAGLKEWMQKVAALPAEQQVEAVARKLQELNPGFDGKVEHGIVGGVVTRLNFPTDNVKEIAPVQALPGLKSLSLNGSSQGKGLLSDLSPLVGMRLKGLSFSYTQVSDLSPLARVPLEQLACIGTPVSDLSPLKGLNLRSLYCGETKVSDLSPLKDMPLTILYCGGAPVGDLSPLRDMKLEVLMCGTKVTDLSPLKGMPLKHLTCSGAPVRDLSPLRGMSLQVLHCWATEVTDLSPLKGMPLKEITCNFRPERDATILRSIPTLKRINSRPAEEVWKEVDAVR
jgi:serine/threonine protein kinase